MNIVVRTLFTIALIMSWVSATANAEITVTTSNSSAQISAIELKIPTRGPVAYTLNPQKPPAKKLQEQRDNYLKVLKSLDSSSRKTFRRLMPTLKDYPLSPYLNYVELASRLRDFPKHDVDTFLARYSATPYANRLRGKWLKELKRRRKAHLFTKYYDPAIASTSLNCYYQHAQYKTGNRQQAIKQGLELWNVGKSQPKDCDPLFTLLTEKNHITETIAWQRYMKALLNHQYQLARYLERFFTSVHYKKRYAIFSNVHKDPRLLGVFHNFSAQDNDTRYIVADTLKHLAKKDAGKALNYWNHYHQSHQFTPKEQSSINERLVKGLFEQDHVAAADIYLEESSQAVPATLIEWRLRKAIAEANWTDIHKWIQLLPAEYQQQSRWQYWLARADQILHKKDPGAVYKQLAQKRDYYGFLSSDILNIPYEMEDQPIQLADQQLLELAKKPGIQRAFELFHLGEALTARREWYAATKGLDESQWLAAAELANRHQWDNRAILSMIKASYWNDMSLRFPLTYLKPMSKAGKKLQIEPNLLMAIARQESALSPTAVSPAGARGLMQMMPATATATSKKYKIKYRNSSDLFDVQKNIELCSLYYKQLLDRFDNNRILASAGYNAGPRRASRWLEKSAGTLDWDMWIETIPFKETRGYVQNILAFSAIYQYRMGEKPSMLTKHEKSQKL